MRLQMICFLRFLRDTVRQPEYYESARALLNMKALTDATLAQQAAFRDEADALEDVLDEAA